MNFHLFRSFSIVAIALAFAGAASAADHLVVALNDVTNIKASAPAVTSKAGKARLKKLAEASFALRKMAESLDDVASEVEERMVRLAANQALQTAQVSH